MTRQRKEIMKKMNVLQMQEEAEYEMGCGFATDKISNIFAPLHKKLNEKLAATYGKTAEEYESMCYDIQHKLYLKGAIPFFM